MKTIGLEPTNRCNRSCQHCFRNKADPPGSLPLGLADEVLTQAAALGFKVVCLTGGEVALYPHLGELLRLIAARDFDFTLVTNGYRFPEYVLPILLEPEVKERLASVFFSLDGARAETHDGLRGPKSFREVIEGATLCRQSPPALVSEKRDHHLEPGRAHRARPPGRQAGRRGARLPLSAFPTPNLIRERTYALPAGVGGYGKRWIQDNLIGVTRNKITVDGHSLDGVILDCGHLVDYLNVDYQGNLIFCCTLSHMTVGDGIPTSFSGELVADLKEVSLKEGIVRQFRKAAEVMEARLNNGGNPKGLSRDSLSLVPEIFWQD